MQDNYENCLAITLKWEGGDVNHPDDPGGKTRWGITQATYDAYRKANHLKTKSVFTMVKSEMLAIYKSNYWDAVKGDTLAKGVDLATWDYGVNSGPARARTALMSVLGGSNVTTVQRLCAKRMSFVRGLKTWKTFGKGWSNRIADIEARGVKMAAKATAPTASLSFVLHAEADKALANAKANTMQAAGTGGGVTAAAMADSISDADQWVSLGLLGIMVVLAIGAIYFIHHARHDKARAEAYARVADE